jgi:long-subunit acyl-CoA synthetase (AMP-forming)
VDAEQRPGLAGATLCEAFPLTAVRFADPPALRVVGEREALTWADYPERVRSLAGDPALQAQSAAAVESANSHLSRVEQIKRFAVLPTDWLPDGDELTPTLKLRRRVIVEKYAAEIDALYAE